MFSDNTYWFQRYPRFTLLLTAILCFISAIVLAEFAIRILCPWLIPGSERVNFWRYDKQLGWAHIPNQQGDFTHRDFSVRVSINSFGFRDDEYPSARTQKKRMLILGDSFAWGFGVEKEQRFSELLEKSHPQWEIINMAVSGYGTAQQWLQLKTQGFPFRPDVVLLLLYTNDFENNVRGEEYWYFKPYFTLHNDKLQLHNIPVPAVSLSQRIRRFIFGRTYLGNAAYRLKEQMNRYLKVSTVQKTSASSVSSKRPSRYSVASHLLKAMNTACKQHGAQFILVSTPIREQQRVFLEKIAQQENIPYLALDETFVGRKKETSFPHDAHWNPLGHQLAADAIQTFLQQLTIF